MNFRRLAQKIRAAVGLDMTIVIFPEEDRYFLEIRGRTPFGLKFCSCRLIDPRDLEDRVVEEVSAQVQEFIDRSADRSSD